MTKPDKTQLDDDDLELFFEAARRDAPKPSEAFLSAIMADAQTQLPNVQTKPATLQKQGWLGSILSAIGGWPAAAGLATATVAGVWIGFTQPVQLETLSGGLVLAGDYVISDASYVLEDLTPGYLGTSIFAEDEG
ncbi:hypothetical protein SAMN04488030_0967 [Aliiroseovarius halocynthiae]|uniref:Dihydroorotate dehydrogenase n=1 Tax=Aliiroseovarius halocynthiae TaxID=985055 RepID=A0A545SVA6_9RHOB|nr:dihydroorotate dehydrogenase [Aliiroseovarius halocynthiae]TQV68901.1 dihydroorotate dehydrogenase [Aliiroseovarius halocynthiae]SMR71450.1 hypothetical protein SAMN04488030_0967 [Aliiroseovarius halocynthiae]